MTGYFDLGGHHRPVPAAPPDAQLWFARGLIWASASNREEAIRGCERATEAHPGCAMAPWGVAYAIGPNYNKAWDAFDPADLTASLARAFTAAQRALACAGGAAPAEQALIAAIAARYPAPAPPVDAAAWNE